MKYSDGQLRGAYSAGLRAGYEIGQRMAKLEGWRRVTDFSQLRIGDYVKALEPTSGGWSGKGRVVCLEQPRSGQRFGGVLVLADGEDTSDVVIYGPKEDPHFVSGDAVKGYLSDQLAKKVVLAE